MIGRAEVLRIAASMTVASALGAAVLGVVFVGTERYRKAAELRAENAAIVELLGLDSTTTVLEIRQYLAGGRDRVIYRTGSVGTEGGPARRLEFSLDGELLSSAEESESERKSIGSDGKKPIPLGRLFLARRGGDPAGFVVEGSARGYKNRIRFLIGLTPEYEIAGVRVVEHEEDPGLGAEIATPLFQGQYFGRAVADLGALEVTRDPMPEDWGAALRELSRLPPGEWRERHGPLIARERGRPIYAVTGATISSRALTDGVRTTVNHFRRRWELLSGYLGGET